MRAPVSADAQVTVYDEAGQWIGNYGATGQPLQQAIWLDNYPVALINAPSAGVPEVAYVQPDHPATPRVAVDPVRDVAIWEWSSKSEVFGNQVPNVDADGDGVGFELALRFPGQQATDASGMFYNYQRDYDPAVGRYAQSDPIGLAGGSSTYNYVEARPTGLLDPLGLRAKCECLGNGKANININFNFVGEGATPEVVSAMRSSIETNWSAPGFSVTTSLGGWRASKITVPTGKGRSFVKGNNGTWYADEDPWVAEHEGGHLMRLEDRYDEIVRGVTTPHVGWEGTIMAEHKGVITPADRQAILDAFGCR